MIVLKKYVLFKLFLTCKIINEVTRNFKSIILLLFIYGRGLDSLVEDSFSVKTLGAYSIRCVTLSILDEMQATRSQQIKKTCNLSYITNTRLVEYNYEMQFWTILIPSIPHGMSLYPTPYVLA